MNEPKLKYIARVFGPYLAALAALQAFFYFFHPQYLKLTLFIYAFVALMGIALFQDMLDKATAPFRQRMAEKIKAEKIKAEKEKAKTRT